MRYCIAGHMGLIGKELKYSLDKRGHQCVLAIDKRGGTHTSDLRNKKVKADIFYHLAANCKIREVIKEPHLAFENIQASYDVFEFCRKNRIPKIVYFSSTRILFPEKNSYTASKVYGEELCKAYYKCYGLEYLIIRPSTVYGGEDKTGRLMEIWIKNAKQDQDLIIYGDKNKTLSFSYVDDFVKGILCADVWNEDYNIAGKEEKLFDVAKEIIKQTNSRSKIVFKKQESAQPQKVKVDTKKIRKLGWKPEVNIKEGIERCLLYG